ncbi:hypothetical protein SH1V18_05400 [Vallitalea longa]|uniref:histidine kinase n=1 Tax=Vallitalea longa TaxID=2936439 RepID=A0A9W5Y7C7_9FIRM|nr:HAMP domain-containing sensor histidine kinase [Vallitalea longa]GKX28060.1 hypothetical protein SH1V18_05400 [Vallitalea longa]
MMKVSLKHRLTIFIILLLITNLVTISLLTMKGIKNNQIEDYEKYLKESSKTANLFIREKYYETDYENLEVFYNRNPNELINELERILGIYPILFDIKGKKLGYSSGENTYNDNNDILTIALGNQIVYKKVEDTIIYMAPVYDFDKQIGVMQLQYSLGRENRFYWNTWGLLLRFGLVSIIITFILGRVYFINIVNKIKKLQESVRLIEDGQYDIGGNIISSKDEFGELSTGIETMAVKIDDNIKQLTDEKAKLQIALERVQNLEKKQKEFISNITHEFKTPITVIKTQIDLMNLYKDDEKLADRSYIVVDKELKRLNLMVEKVLHLSSLDKYEFEIRKQIIHTDILLQDIIDKLKAKASKYGITIRSELTPCQVCMDKESFMMIFINLIDNAIKYNITNGRISVTSIKKGDFNQIEIEDTGIGIPDECKERVFEPFYTVDKNKSKELSGTGLGLSLVKKMLEKQSSTIELMDSDEGTVFRLNIPIKD